MEALIRRLRERKLVQWALAYVAASFAGLQILGIVADSLEWPRAAMRWGLSVVLLGFLVTLVLAWYHGERGAQRVSGAELSILAALLLASGVGVALLRPRGAAALPPVAAPVFSDSLRIKTLAVLPFVSLSDSSVNANFADGIHDELLMQLSRIADLQVISRASVMRYRNSTQPLRQIARELGVGSIVEGSVQRAGGRVRIEVHLVDARTDRHLWAQSYTRGAEDVFAVETDVATQIAQAMEARLTEREQAAIGRPPTASAEANGLYLRGYEYLNTPDVQSMDTEAAERLFERAVTVDPRFAAAWGGLAFAYELHANVLAWGRKPGAQALTARSRAAAEHALRLDRDVADAHIALGLQAETQRDFRGALREFEVAREAHPSSGEAWGGIAAELQHLGRWDEAVAACRKAVELDPRSKSNLAQLSALYATLWRYPEAIRSAEHLAAIAPESGWLPGQIAWLRLMEDGDTGRYRRTIEALPVRDAGHGTRMQMYENERNFAAALREIVLLPQFLDTEGVIPKSLESGDVLRMAGDTVAARIAYDSARAALEPATRANPLEPQTHRALSWAYAGLGRKADAIREARRALEARRETDDALEGPGYSMWLAVVYAWFGEKDAAFRLLDHLVTVPGGPTAVDLRIIRGVDPLRADPRFPRLMARAETEQRQGRWSH
ncbi:serine/threonine protein kinase [bacterium JGI 053]|nr:serine/threonine protein kinase [bacterium JGI 053]